MSNKEKDRSESVIAAGGGAIIVTALAGIIFCIVLGISMVSAYHAIGAK